MTDTSQPLFLFGPGYSATVLAGLWSGPVRGSLRTPEKRAALVAARIEPVAIFDGDAVQAALADSHLVISVPPDAEGCPALRQLSPYVASARSVTYLSTTGVYGNLDGGWAMEWSPLQPGSARGHRRVKAEQDWQSAFPSACIVRLPGIYGPGRSALERLQTGRARRIIKPGQVFSRIHVEDLARGVKALITAGRTGCYNLCDDVAAPPQDVIVFAAELLRMPPPPAQDYDLADLTPMAQSFYSECKRVSNARIKAATGWRPKYPTYQCGLRAVFESQHRQIDV